VVDGPHEVAAGAEGVVYDDGDAGFVSDGGDLLEVGDVVLWVADGFDVDGFGLFVDGSFEVFGVIAVDEFGRDAEAGEGDLELVVCAAVTGVFLGVYS
jgi:hypothetical protein